MKPADISNQVRYYEEVPSLLRSELLRFGEGATVIHAGHYMLHVADNGHASDYLGSESEPRPGFEAFEFFTRATWDIACEAIQQAGSSGDLKLMVLVNDWQCLIFRAVSRRESERGADLAPTQCFARPRAALCFQRANFASNCRERSGIS